MHRVKRKRPERWIESRIGDRTKSAIMEFLLPKGEGQDEGEPRVITQRRAFSFKRPTESDERRANFRMRFEFSH